MLIPNIMIRASGRERERDERRRLSNNHLMRMCVRMADDHEAQRERQGEERRKSNERK